MSRAEVGRETALNPISTRFQISTQALARARTSARIQFSAKAGWPRAAGRRLFVSTARIVLILLTCMTGASAAARADSAPATVTFSPQGTIKNVRQVVARFSQPMVPLGDPRGTQSPFQ